MKYTLADATINDVEAIFSLMQKLAIFEKKVIKDIKNTAEKIAEDAFSTQPKYKILLAKVNENAIGYAFYFFTYSSPLGAPILYLEDLFVEEEHRNHGIGKAMLKTLADYAKEKNCCRMDWQVYNWNQAAMDFYKSLGAEARDDLIPVRLPI